MWKLKDFRPISLIGGVYKILSKLITEILKSAIGKLVDVQQWEPRSFFFNLREVLDKEIQCYLFYLI